MSQKYMYMYVFLQSLFPSQMNNTEQNSRRNHANDHDDSCQYSDNEDLFVPV